MLSHKILKFENSQKLGKFFEEDQQTGVHEIFHEFHKFVTKFYFVFGKLEFIL